MEIHITENLKTMISKGMENLFGKMGDNMMVHGKTIK